MTEWAARWCPPWDSCGLSEQVSGVSRQGCASVLTVLAYMLLI